jgi:hypothetical protein
MRISSESGCISKESISDISRWMSLLSIVQKAHYKSSSIPKIMACLDIYRALAAIEAIRSLVLTKVVSMLLHPFPNVSCIDIIIS